VGWRPDEWVPICSDPGRRVMWLAGWRFVVGPRVGRKGMRAESEVVGPPKGKKVFLFTYSYFLFNSNLNSNSNLNPHK
jgi:hypothetical protein